MFFLTEWMAPRVLAGHCVNGHCQPFRTLAFFLFYFYFSLLFRYSRPAIPLHPPEAMELPIRPRVGRPPTFPFDHLSKHVRHPIYPFAAAPAVSLFRFRPFRNS